MGDPIITVLTVGGLLLLVLPLILAVSALTQIGHLRKRIQRLEAELRETKRGVRSALFDSETEPRATPREAQSPTADAPAPSTPTPPAPLPPPPPPPIKAPDPEPDPEPEPKHEEVPQPAPSLPASSAPEPAPPSEQGGGWEKWVGVRGAAVVGGLLLALAGLLLYKHAVDQGWITPSRRILAGAAVGTVALAIGEYLWRKRFRFAPDGLSAAGCVTLYGTIWAAHRLYGFLGLPAALPLMALVTAACVFVAVRFRSQIVASIGLLGGFATPVLLSVHHEHPLGLFGYLLLLDLALLGLSRKQRWPMLSTMAIAGTAVVQALWTAANRHSDILPIALIALAVFALLLSRFTPTSRSTKRASQLLELASRAGALLLPVGFALYFATRADLGTELWPLALFLGVLGVAALPLQRLPEGDWVPGVMVVSVMTVAATWLFGKGGSVIGYDWALSMAGLSLLFTAGDLSMSPPESSKRTPRAIGPGPLLILGVLGVNVIAATRAGPDGAIWPYLIATIPLYLLLHVDLHRARPGQLPATQHLRIPAAILSAILLGQYLNGFDPYAPMIMDAWSVLILFSAAASLALPALLLRGSASDERRTPSLRAAELAAALFSLTLVLALAGQASETPLALRLELGLVFALCVLASLISVPRTPLLHGLSLLAFAAHRWIDVASQVWLYGAERSGHPAVWLELLALTLLLFLPLATPKSIGRRHVPMAASGLALLLFYFHLQNVLPSLLPSAGAKTTLLVLASLGAALLAGLRLRLGARGSGPAIAWLGSAVSILLASLLARWITPPSLRPTVTLTLIAVFLTLVWHRRRWSAVIVFAALFAIGAVIAEGVAILQPDSRYFVLIGTDLIVWNWPSLLAGLPAAAALAISLLLRSGLRKQHRPRPSENAQIVLRRLAVVFAVMTAAHGFVWLNLQVFVAFSPGELLQIRAPSLPARNLTMSIVWALYAIALLALGMLRAVPGLRQLSLVFLLGTLLKVFLYDLGDLEGLYRVGSLFGLAVSMLLVSLLYQRFVFPRAQGEKSQPGEEEELSPRE